MFSDYNCSLTPLYLCKWNMWLNAFNTNTEGKSTFHIYLIWTQMHIDEYINLMKINPIGRHIISGKRFIVSHKNYVFSYHYHGGFKFIQIWSITERHNNAWFKCDNLISHYKQILWNKTRCLSFNVAVNIKSTQKCVARGVFSRTRGPNCLKSPC